MSSIEASPLPKRKADFIQQIASTDADIFKILHVNEAVVPCKSSVLLSKNQRLKTY